MSKRKPARPTRPTPTPSIELSAGRMGGGLVVVVLVAVAFWWWRGQTDGTGTSAPQASPPAAAPALVASPSDGKAGQSTVGAPGAAVDWPASPLSVSDPDQGAWTTPEGHPALGSQAAPVTVVVYSDYQCPNCRQFAREVMPWMRQTWLSRGLVRVVYRDFVLRGEGSERAAEAAHCAGSAGRFWRFHDLLFENQAQEETATAYPIELLVQWAKLAGLDEGAFEKCLAEHRFAARVQESTQTAKDQQFVGTPTFLVNGRKTQGAIPIPQWDELFRLFEQELAAGNKP